MPDNNGLNNKKKKTRRSPTFLLCAHETIPNNLELADVVALQRLTSIYTSQKAQYQRPGSPRDHTHSGTLSRSGRYSEITRGTRDETIRRATSSVHVRSPYGSRSQQIGCFFLWSSSSFVFTANRSVLRNLRRQ